MLFYFSNLQLISVVPFPLSCYVHLRVCSVQCSDCVLHGERVNGDLTEKKTSRFSAAETEMNDKSQPCIHDYLVGVLMHEYYVILSYNWAISLYIGLVL